MDGENEIVRTKMKEKAFLFVFVVITNKYVSNQSKNGTFSNKWTTKGYGSELLYLNGPVLQTAPFSGHNDTT